MNHHGWACRAASRQSAGVLTAVLAAAGLWLWSAGCTGPARQAPVEVAQTGDAGAGEPGQGEAAFEPSADAAAMALDVESPPIAHEDVQPAEEQADRAVEPTAPVLAGPLGEVIAPSQPANWPLVRIASFPDRQVTGVAVSRRGRVFVCFPRWRAPYAMAVAEVLGDGTLRPYPDERWNAFAEDPRTPPPPEGDRFVCVQAVHVDDRDRLWILDAANPRFEGVVREGGGPKLVHVDLATDSVVSTVRFGPEIAKDGSYLNDVRIDTVDDTAFITDSGVGAIIVADLARGDARRLLDGHPSTQADPEYVPVIGGRDLRFHTADGATGDSPRIHADGIALDQKRQVLYWQALTGNRLHRIDARLLKSRTAEGWQLADSVQDLGPTVVSDGMECDALGNLYFTALEHSAIMMLPDRGREGLRPTRSGTPTNPETRAAPLALRTVLIDERIAWPDSLAIGPEGPPPPGREGGARPGRWLYFTTSRIHQIAPFEAPGTMPEGGTAVWRTWLPGQ